MSCVELLTINLGSLFYQYIDHFADNKKNDEISAYDNFSEKPKIMIKAALQIEEEKKSILRQSCVKKCNIIDPVQEYQH